MSLRVCCFVFEQFAKLFGMFFWAPSVDRFAPCVVVLHGPFPPGEFRFCRCFFERFAKGFDYFMGRSFCIALWFCKGHLPPGESCVLLIFGGLLSYRNTSGATGWSFALRCNL